MRRRTILILALAVGTFWAFFATYQVAVASGDTTLWETGWGVLPFVALLAFVPYLVRRH